MTSSLRIASVGALRALASLGALGLAAACSKGPTQGGGDPPPVAGPQITAVSPATLVPGTAATISGSNFSATATSNTVSIGGQDAVVISATASQLQVVVPCALSGTVAVQVTSEGRASNTLSQSLQATRRTLAVGQAEILTNVNDVSCSELAPSGGSARYVVAVYNTASAPGTVASFRVSGDGVARSQTVVPAPSRAVTLGGPAPSAPSYESRVRELAEERHHELLEKNRAAYAQLFARFAGDPRMRRTNRTANVVPPPATRTFRVSNINASQICANYFNVTASRVYYNGRIAIYQDDSNPITTSHATLGATMQEYYNRIGDQFNQDMEPIIRGSFGDVLRRDAVTDNNGVLVALFTNAINTNMANVAGFVVSCDQFPNDEGATNATNTTSNFGEYFYAYVPTVAESGYANSSTPDSWYRSIRSTFIHEAKHVASQAARVANSAGSWEAGWLEEGTARHSEELWARQAVYGVSWKGNTGYGSATELGSVYCDVRPTSAACLASNARRPSVNMVRHFSALYEFLGTPWARSPFGRANGDAGSSFYATSWSLARYAIDRYGTSEAAFLTALNQSAQSGAANLATAAGVSIEQLLGGWALALYADDFPGLANPSADLRFPTWNLPGVYAGLQTDFPTTYTRTGPAGQVPVTADRMTFGSFAPIAVSDIAGGGVRYVEFSGTHAAPQLIRLEGASGGLPPSTLRVAIARLQ